MKPALIAFYVFVIVVMAVGLTLAGMKQNMFVAGGALMRDPWFVATLADTYFAFLTIAGWMAWKERFGFAAWAWVLGVLVLGNLAIAAYMLLQLARWRPAEGVAALLTSRRSGA
jgi:hypothetical protein